MRLSIAARAFAVLCCAAVLPACAATAPSVSSADVADVIAQQIQTRLAITVEVDCGEVPHLTEAPVDLPCTVTDPHTAETYGAAAAVRLDSTGSLVVDFRVHDG